MNERLMFLRKTLGITKESMAKQLGLAEQDIWDMEIGKKEITDELLKQICEGFNINPRWLKSGRGSMIGRRRK